MDRYDPNEWTGSFVKENTAFCMEFLRETNQKVIDLLEEGTYDAAVAGIDRILNGLIVLQNNTSGNYKPHICMISWMEAFVIAFGVDASEDQKRETVINCLQDAYDFAKSENTKEDIMKCINDFKSGAPFDEIYASEQHDFPGEVIEILSDIDGKLVANNDGAGNSSGGCYVATAVYGSYDCPEVWTLRRFRDNVLHEKFFGRIFIKCYYALSPTVVKIWGKSKVFKGFFKPRLDKLVHRLNSQGVENTPYNDKNF